MSRVDFVFSTHKQQQYKLHSGDISPTICFDREQKPINPLEMLRTIFKERKLSPIKRFIIATRFAIAK